MIQQVPNTTFYTRVRDNNIDHENPFRWQLLSSDEIFANKNVVVLALPGAFTPTCSSTHLPGFEAKYDELRACGIDEVYCLSVNDAFCMYQWAKQLGIKSVKMLPDGNGDFTRLMGMLVDKHNLGFGYRSWRYSMHVVNGQIKQLFVEPGLEDNCAEDPFTCSDVDTMLQYLR